MASEACIRFEKLAGKNHSCFLNFSLFMYYAISDILF